ncbi:MAG: DUF2178 domain-containing protein [Patescibacteria group bacterium]|nr:DUF2178 domain-containing protein [Patescibacteria group bacterium]
MNVKRYKQIRIAVALFVGFIVSIAAVQDSYILAFFGVITGMIFLVLVRSKTKIKIDEREKTIREKAAQMTYAIFAPTIGIGAFLLLILSYGKISVFSKGDFTYLESLGMIFAYLTLFLITLYAISYYFFNRKYGGGGNEE